MMVLSLVFMEISFLLVKVCKLEFQLSITLVPERKVPVEDGGAFLPALNLHL